MQGMRFLLLDENGNAINNGIITQKVTDERYMCTFMRPPQVSRLCHVNEIGTWNLFPTDEALQTFVNVLNEQPPADPPADPPPGDKPPGTKKKAKKKASKKVAKKKTNGKTKR